MPKKNKLDYDAPSFRVVCQQKTLKSIVAKLMKITPKKPTCPILAYLLFEADTYLGQLTISGFDLVTGASIDVEGEVKIPGKIAIEAKTLYDILSNLEDCEVVISSVYGNAYLECGNKKYPLTHQSADEFPQIPSVKGYPVEIDRQTFCDGISSVLFCIDSSYSCLNNVWINAKGNTITFLATDGKRIAVAQFDKTEDEISPDFSEEIDLLISNLNLKSIISILKDSSFDYLQLCSDGNNVYLSSPDFFTPVRIITKVSTDKYPRDSAQLIDFQSNCSIVCDRKRLIKGIERVAIFMEKFKNETLLFTVDQENQILTISMASEHGIATEKIPVSTSGSLEIKIYTPYLLEFLQNLSSNEVQIQFKDQESLFLVTPLGMQRISYGMNPIKDKD